MIGVGGGATQGRILATEAPYAAAHAAFAAAVSALRTPALEGATDHDVLDLASRGESTRYLRGSVLPESAPVALLSLRSIQGSHGAVEWLAAVGEDPRRESRKRLAIAAALLRVLVRDHIDRRVMLAAIEESSRRQEQTEQASYASHAVNPALYDLAGAH
jgi:hypothetical protein